MRIERFDPFGAEIAGASAHEIDAGGIARIRDALAAEGVVVLRDQDIDDDAFVRFLEGFGPLTFTRGETPLPGRPELNFVTNEGRTTPPRSVFHTDTSYVSEPPAYTALRAVTLPEAGGETVFANQFLAHDTLPANSRDALAHAEVLHEVTGVDPGEGQEVRTWHPLLRRHPVSGRTALFLSTPERCTAVRVRGREMDGAEARALIRSLFEHSTAPERLYRHRWRAGDILMWDDRCTLHKADHTAVSGIRRLHRGMVAGERPIAA